MWTSKDIVGILGRALRSPSWGLVPWRRPVRR